MQTTPAGTGLAGPSLGSWEELRLALGGAVCQSIRILRCKNMSKQKTFKRNCDHCRPARKIHAITINFKLDYNRVGLNVQVDWQCSWMIFPSSTSLTQHKEIPAIPNKSLKFFFSKKVLSFFGGGVGGSKSIFKISNFKGIINIRLIIVKQCF